MPTQPKHYGILERLPPELQYLKQVVWEGWEATQAWEEALHDDNPEYFGRVAATMQQHFRGLPPHLQLTEAMRHRELIGEFTERYPSDDYPETSALLFIWGALTYPDALFKKPSA